jgi:hypothetical protein
MGMTPQETSRRHFIQGLVACVLPATHGVREPTGRLRTQLPELTSEVIRERIGLALDLQAIFAIAIDQIDIDALTTNRLVCATTGKGKGRNRGRDAALNAVLRHGPDFRSAAGSLLLLGVRPRTLRLSDLAAARRAVRSAGAGGHQFIYAVYPDRHLLDGQVEATVLAAWD